MRERLKALCARIVHNEEGFNTAELLGNAALAIVALLAIWAALEASGIRVIEWIEQQLLGS